MKKIVFILINSLIISYATFEFPYKYATFTKVTINILNSCINFPVKIVDFLPSPLKSIIKLYILLLLMSAERNIYF